MGDLELTKAVQVVRDDLLAAAAQGAGQQVQFEVGPIEMEFTVEIRVDTKVRAGFRVWVVSADAEAGAGRASTHKVTVTLTPKDAKTGGPLLISDAADAAPAGTAEPLGSAVSR
jgi:Trypsin-co-occurring domain 2